MNLEPKWERQESCPECDGDGCEYCEPSEGDHLSAMSTPLDYAEFYFGHVDKGESMKAPDEGVAAPLEPSQRRIIQAARDADWQQVILNGGPPCFYLGGELDNFCLRAKRWEGHDDDHKFTSLEDLLAAVSKNLQEELAQLRKYFDLRGNDVNNTWRDYCAEKRKLERAESRILELEKEIAALRRELSAEINAPGRTDF